MSFNLTATAGSAFKMVVGGQEIARFPYQTNNKTWE